MSAIVFFFSASSTKTHCQPCALEPVGACSASSRHSVSTSRLTGLSKSRRLRTERVVVRSSSTDRLRVMCGGYRDGPEGGGSPKVAGLRADRQGDAAQPFGDDGDRAACVLDLPA